MEGGVLREQPLDGRARGQVGGILGAADELFDASKEEDLDADGLGDSSHIRIVARAARKRER